MVYCLAIWYILYSFGIVFPVLVCCTEKNLATLPSRYVHMSKWRNCTQIVTHVCVCVHETFEVQKNVFRFQVSYVGWFDKFSDTRKKRRKKRFGCKIFRFLSEWHLSSTNSESARTCSEKFVSHSIRVLGDDAIFCRKQNYRTTNCRHLKLSSFLAW
jgi:hypothetical protein